MDAVCFPAAGRLNHPRGDCCAAAVAGKLIVAGGWTTDYADTLGSVEVGYNTTVQHGEQLMQVVSRASVVQRSYHAATPLALAF